MKSARAT